VAHAGFTDVSPTALPLDAANTTLTCLFGFRCDLHDESLLNSDLLPLRVDDPLSRTVLLVKRPHPHLERCMADGRATAIDNSLRAINES